jgi:hypothetical protein
MPMEAPAPAGHSKYKSQSILIMPQLDTVQVLYNVLALSLGNKVALCSSAFVFGCDYVLRRLTRRCT